MAGFRRLGVEHIVSFVFLAGSLALALDALTVARLPPTSFVGILVQWSPESYVPYYFGGFAGLALLLGMVAYPFGGRGLLRTRVVPWVQTLNDSTLRTLRVKNSWVVLSMVGLTLAFLAVRLVVLSSFLGPDEGLYREASLAVLNWRCPTPPLLGEGECNLQHPPLAKLFMVFSMELAGRSLTAAKLPSLLLGTLTIPLSGLVAWSLTRNRMVTILSAALLSLDPMFFGWTTLANLDATEIFFTTGAIALYVSRPQGSMKNAVTGALVGLAMLSKEVAVFALGGLITYHLVTSVEGRLKGALLILAAAVGTSAAGLQIFDSLFTPFPNFLAHISYIISYGTHELLTWSNPLYWLISITAEPWGTYYILDIFASTLALVWVPIGIWKIGRSANARALVLASLLLLWTYVPFEFIYLTGRVEYYYYAVQMVPAIALGGAYLLSYSRLPKSLVILILVGSVAWFILFFPLGQQYLPRLFKPD